MLTNLFTCHTGGVILDQAQEWFPPLKLKYGAHKCEFIPHYLKVREFGFAQSCLTTTVLYTLIENVVIWCFEH